MALLQKEGLLPLQASRNEADAAVALRKRVQAQAEHALSAAEAEKREAWQAIDRVTAELDRARERGDRAEYRLNVLQNPSRTSDQNQELLKARTGRPGPQSGRRNYCSML